MPVDPQSEPKDPLPGPGVSPTPARRLTRSTSDKHVAGVAGGLGQYFGIDPIIFRIGFAAAALVNLVGNQWVERSATATAALKIVGIAVLAIAGILAAGVLVSLWTTRGGAPTPRET